MPPRGGGPPPPPATGGGAALKSKSPAEFFADNKVIAGFDNPGKSLYTTVRELVENSLDSAEGMNVLPDIELTIVELTRESLNARLGLKAGDRKDERLYDDYETDKQKAKRLKQEAKEAAKLEKAATAASSLPAKAKAAAAAASDKTYYVVTCRDNGTGMRHADIPNMLGRVLSGTKYGVKQTRGKFGLGAKMALIWSKQSTGLPIEVTSSTGTGKTSYYKLDIDIHRNEPNVHEQSERPSPERWHGTEISVTIEGDWKLYGHRIVKYLRQLAVITPYAKIDFRYRSAAAAAAAAAAAEDDGDGDGDDDPLLLSSPPLASQGKAAPAAKGTSILFARRTECMPRPPRETKHHPSSVDVQLIKTLLTQTPQPDMASFLSKEFSCINASHAKKLLLEMEHEGLNARLSPHKVSDTQALALHQLLSRAKFGEPDGSHLSPAGEYNLRLGIMKELKPDMIATHESDVKVNEGHTFVVEAAVSLGGREVKPGLNVLRFANRIPLLFEAGNDVITRTAQKRISWSTYKINVNTDRVGVFVSIVSTKIPFKGTSKEYIGDDVKAMADAVQGAISKCCSQLKQKLVRINQAKERQQRKKNLTRYIPDVVNAVHAVLGSLASDGASDAAPAAKRRRKLAECSAVQRGAGDGRPMGAGGSFAVLEEAAPDVDDALLELVARGAITKEGLADGLAAHVNALDAGLDDALAGGAAVGAAGAGGAGAGATTAAYAAEDLCLVPYCASDAAGRAIGTHRALDEAREAPFVIATPRLLFQPLVRPL